MKSENIKPDSTGPESLKPANADSTKNKILTIPNLLSLFRLCLIPVFMWLYCVEKNYLWTGIILIISGLTDTVDGFVARHFNMISDLGKILDPVADKLTQAAMLFCLLTRFPLMIVPLGLMVFKEFFMGVTGLLLFRRRERYLVRTGTARSIHGFSMQ